jgi:hypothetical protein
MLSQSNINKINDAIADEMRTVTGAFTSHEDKTAAIERIAQLKELLNPQPSRQDILRELAAALKEQSTPTTPNTADVIADIFATFRR